MTWAPPKDQPKDGSKSVERPSADLEPVVNLAQSDLFPADSFDPEAQRTAEASGKSQLEGDRLTAEFNSPRAAS